MVGRATLPRAEWDFSGCPPEQSSRCWPYEFGREVEWVREAYKRLRPYRDEFGNVIFFRDLGEPEDADYDQIGFFLFPGFPELPFLEALRRGAKIPEPRFTLRRPSAVRQGSRDPIPPFEKQLTITINTAKSLKANMKAIERILAKMPLGKVEKRGHSERRRYEADLKALGAYRLLQSGMSATAATEYTRRVKGASLFVKESEWYAAKRRALAIIERLTSASR